MNVTTKIESSRLESAICIAAGAAVGFASLVAVNARIGTFEINAVNLALLVAPSLYFLWPLSPGSRRAWFALSGCALIGTGYLLEHPHVLDGGAITLGLICTAVYLVLSQLKPEGPSPVRRLDAVIAIASAAMTVAIYRAFTVLAADIPNEERSLIIGGYEVHHLNVGLAGALLLSVISVPAGPMLRAIYFILLGSALGGWIDQIGYYLYAALGDAEYSQPVSIAGAVIGLVLLSVSAAIATRRSFEQ